MSASPEQLIRETKSPEETIGLGQVIGRQLVGGLCIGLVGTLGAGKTQLVKGIAAGNAAGEAPPVTSPTFTLVHEYPGRVLLYHIDAYRLHGASELAALGFDEMLCSDSAAVVEWADKVEGLMPTDTLWIDIATVGETVRTFTFRAAGERARKCQEAISSVRR